MACARPDWPRTSDSVRAGEFGECSPGPSERFVITNDSVGPFSIAGTTMGDVLDSCGAADTAWVDRCCSMAMVARVQYPGVMLEADQSVDSGNKLITMASVRQWEVSGDSVYLSDGQFLPKTVAELSRLGPGFAINPMHDGHDGPQAFSCGLPNLRFRLGLNTADTAQAWVIDSSAFNRGVQIAGVVVYVPHQPITGQCRKMVDTIKTRR